MGGVGVRSWPWHSSARCWTRRSRWVDGMVLGCEWIWEGGHHNRVQLGDGWDG